MPDLTNASGSEILGSRSKFKEETDLDDNYIAPEQRMRRDKRHLFSDESSVKTVKNSTNIGKGDGKSSDKRRVNHPTRIEGVKNDKKSSHPCGTYFMYQHHNGDFLRTAEQICTKMEPINSDTSKALKDTENASLQNHSNDFNKINAEGPVADEASTANHNISGVTVSTAFKEAEDILKEAEKLKIHAVLIKNSGFGSESNYEYFKAALKFLHGASLLEACDEESSKHLQMTPLQLYSASAKLWKSCACEFEKDHEMAAAALAYKCMEVTCLRIVYCKSSTTSRLWNDLQSSLQMVPQGESPSSSASDVDNLNNLEMADKATLPKGSSSRVGNYGALPRNCPNVFQLLDFAKDADSAIGAAKKSQESFSAAHLELKKSKNEEAIISIKRVMDLGFQNLEELVHAVWLAFNNLTHQDLNSNKE